MAAQRPLNSPCICLPSADAELGDLRCYVDAEFGVLVQCSQILDSLSLNISNDKVIAKLGTVHSQLFPTASPDAGISCDARPIHGTPRAARGTIAAEVPVCAASYLAAGLYYAVADRSYFVVAFLWNFFYAFFGKNQIC